MPVDRRAPGAVAPVASSVAYDAARVIVGDETVIAPATFVVQDERFTAVGPQGSVTVPRGAAHVDLGGRTVMPALVNAHVHVGYEGYTSWGASNYTPANVLDRLRREAYDGVAATQSVGSSPTDASLQFVKDQQVTTAAQARAAVQGMRAKGIVQVKI